MYNDIKWRTPGNVEKLCSEFFKRCNIRQKVSTRMLVISEGGGKKTIHYNGSEETVELILRTVISVNQLSV